MTKNKDPAFLFYPSDFLTGTMLMSDEQVGKYIRIMCLQHQMGHLSKADMIQICGEKDEKIFNKFLVDKQGFYYNKRLEEEVDRRKEYSKSRKINGSKGGRPKKACAKHVQSTCKACENHTETETITINEADTPNEMEHKISNKEISDFYESVWALYPIKRGKAAVSEAQKKKLFAIGCDEIARAISRYDSEITDRQFMKHGSTFFNGGYIDYLDANYVEDGSKKGRKGSVFANIAFEGE